MFNEDLLGLFKMENTLLPLEDRWSCDGFVKCICTKEIRAGKGYVLHESSEFEGLKMEKYLRPSHLFPDGLDYLHIQDNTAKVPFRMLNAINYPLQCPTSE